eukprot:748481-Hanusia_phi.AAC.3
MRGCQSFNCSIQCIHVELLLILGYESRLPGTATQWQSSHSLKTQGRCIRYKRKRRQTKSQQARKHTAVQGLNRSLERSGNPQCSVVTRSHQQGVKNRGFTMKARKGLEHRTNKNLNESAKHHRHSIAEHSSLATLDQSILHG